MFNHAALILSPQDCSHSEEIAAMKGFFTNWLIIGCWSFIQHPHISSSPTPLSNLTPSLLTLSFDGHKTAPSRFGGNSVELMTYLPTTALKLVFVCEAPNSSSSSKDPIICPPPDDGGGHDGSNSTKLAFLTNVCSASSLFTCPQEVVHCWC